MATASNVHNVPSTMYIYAILTWHMIIKFTCAIRNSHKKQNIIFFNISIWLKTADGNQQRQTSTYIVVASQHFEFDVIWNKCNVKNYWIMKNVLEAISN